MSKLRTFRRRLDSDAVDRAAKANVPMLRSAGRSRIGHGYATKPAKKLPLAAVVVASSRLFFSQLDKKQERAAKKPARVKYLQRLRDVDFKRKVRRYQERHSASV
jgi:hypothetical protein